MSKMCYAYIFSNTTSYNFETDKSFLPTISMVAGVYPKHDNPLIICMEALALHSVQPGTGMLQITCMHHTRAWAQVGFTACWLQIDFVYSVYYLSIKCGE